MNDETTNAESQELQTAESSTVTGFLQAIERISANPKVDPDKLERLLDIQMRAMDKQAEIDFNQAMQRAQSRIPIIKADAENKQTNSKYAKLHTINRIASPIWSEEGFSLSFGTGDSPLERHVRVICDVSHTSGHSKRYQYDSPYDDKGLKGTKNKTDTHASGSALEYGRRYLTKLIFNITTTDDILDDDGNGAGNPVETIDDKQLSELRDLVAAWEPSEEQSLAMLDYFKITDLDELPASDYKEAKRILQSKVKAKNNADN